MKKAIGIIILGLLWCNVGSANFEWIKTEKFSTTNSLTWEDKFQQMIKSNISSEKFYLGMSSNNKKTSLFDNFLSILFEASKTLSKHLSCFFEVITCSYPFS